MIHFHVYTTYMRFIKLPCKGKQTRKDLIGGVDNGMCQVYNNNRVKMLQNQSHDKVIVKSGINNF